MLSLASTTILATFNGFDCVIDFLNVLALLFDAASCLFKSCRRGFNARSPFILNSLQSFCNLPFSTFVGPAPLNRCELPIPSR